MNSTLTKDRGRQILSISRRVIRGSGDTSGREIMNNKTREVRLNITHTRQETITVKQESSFTETD